MFDLIVRTDDADLGISEGRIEAVAPGLEGGAAREIDGRGLLVLPGMVDTHVHLNDPGRKEWEGFATGTAALAAGGATTCIDMPLNSIPPTLDGASFDAKVEAAHGVARIDFALWGGLVPGDVNRLDELAGRGVVGFKAFMSPSGVAEFEAADDLTLYEGMSRAARLGLPVAVHAESAAITAGLTARALAGGRTSMRDYLDSRPVVAEVEAIGRAIALAHEAGASLHVVHVSTGRGAALIAEARASGLDVTCETCPHYLLLTEEDAERIGAAAKCAPPLRPAREVDALWAALRYGPIDMVASDHSPSPPNLKRGDDAFASWGGIAGCQTALPLVLGAAEEHGVSRQRVVELVAKSPARRFRLPAKGTLEVGADADIVLIDPRRREPLRADELLYRHPVSPFLGRVPGGRVVRTLLRGQEVGATPRGRLVVPTGTGGATYG